MITIISTDKSVSITNGSEILKGELGEFQLFRSGSYVLVIQNGIERFRDVLSNISINETVLTNDNYQSLTESIFEDGGSSFEVTIIDTAKTETPATDGTGSWTWGQLFRGILSTIVAISSKIWGHKGSVSTILTGVQTTTTSADIDCSGFNALLVSTNFTAGAGVGYFNISLQGKFDAGGTYMDLYDNNDNKLETSSITANRIKLFAAVPDFVKVVATETTDGATVTVKVQPINI